MKLKTIKNSALKHGGEFNNGFLIMPEGKLEAFTNSLFGIKASGEVKLIKEPLVVTAPASHKP